MDLERGIGQQWVPTIISGCVVQPVITVNPTWVLRPSVWGTENPIEIG